MDNRGSRSDYAHSESPWFARTSPLASTKFSVNTQVSPSVVVVLPTRLWNTCCSSFLTTWVLLNFTSSLKTNVGASKLTKVVPQLWKMKFPDWVSSMWYRKDELKHT